MVAGSAWVEAEALALAEADGVAEDVEDTAAALLPPEPANARKPPTPSPTTTRQITATIVIWRAL